MAKITRVAHSAVTARLHDDFDAWMVTVGDFTGMSDTERAAVAMTLAAMFASLLQLNADKAGADAREMWAAWCASQEAHR